MISNERAKKLLDKYTQGNSSAEDQQLVEEWYSNQLEDEATIGLPDNFEFKNKEVLRLLQEKISPAARVRKIRFWMAAAAVFFLVMSTFVYRMVNENTTLEKSVIGKMDLKPAIYDQPVFEQANGEVIILDNTQSAIIIDLTSVSYRNGGKVANPSSLDPDGVNKIITPKGKNFEITLPDGSRVWLNASSSLAYTNSFLTGNREVILEGEGYFEITPDKARPFRVLSSSQVVRVLGTHFNIKSYEGEAVKTTLLEGSVHIESKLLDKVILKPDEESTLQDGKSGFEVRKVKAQNALAWRNGYFRFDNASLRSVLYEFGRWYDIKIVEDLKEDNYEFVGTIDRSLSLNKSLQILKIYGVDFDLNENVLVIHNKPKS